MQAFVVRPFKTQNGIDFDRVHTELIAPALDAAGIIGGTTGLILEAGNIREDMFRLLLVADLVVADISIHNANVFYELGIRHALRSRQTFMVRGRVDKPPEQRRREDQVPFDLSTDRYLEYDPADPKASLAALTQALKATRTGDRIDSPVFRSLPRLTEPEHDRLNPVPMEFVNDADLAAGRKESGKLGLLGREAGWFTWEMGGLRVIGREQFNLELYGPARATWERLRSVYPDDLEANLLLGTIHQRLKDLTLSDQRLQQVMNHPGRGRRDEAEALALLARNEKTRARRAWMTRPAAERRTAALRARLLEKSWELYEQAFGRDLNHYYPGLNALSLVTLLLNIIGQERSEWTGIFDTDPEADQRESEMKASRDRLAAAVGLSLEAARAQGAKDPWFAISEADYKFLTSARDRTAAAAYESVVTGAEPFHISAARSQLELFRDLGACATRVEACLAVFPPVPPDQALLAQAIMFTGHMIDAPGRKDPRFPSSQEPIARAAIRKAVGDLLAATPGPAIGIAGGANGGDILFHEVCAELDVPTRVLLTLPPGPFIAESVAHGGPDWIRRFNALIQKQPTEVLGDDKQLPRWMRDREGYDVWQRTNLWLLEEALAAGAPFQTLVALWDGKGGDGPGGTKHLVELARDRGLTTQVLSTAEIFSL